MLTRLVVIKILLLTFPFIAFSQNNVGESKANIKSLITNLHKYPWNGAQIIGESPTIWLFGFTEPIQEILKIGYPAQKELLPYLKDESINDQVIILLGGIGDEKSVSQIINSMVSERRIKTNPKADRINSAANLALTNITVADVIWHHGGGIVIENCPDNPKECWAAWWEKNKTTFSVKGIKQSRHYSNYPNYGIYKINNA